MKAFITFLFAALALSCLAQGEPTTAAHGTQGRKSAGFDPARDAAKDLAAGIAKAKKEHKRVLIDVGGEWCPWCHKLEEFFEANKDATALRNKFFVLVKINWSPENKNEAVLSQYPKVTGYPHLFVLDSDGKLLKSENTGLLESGDHHDHDKVMAFLKEWAK
jgi:thiol:disulfide interchange protein